MNLRQPWEALKLPTAGQKCGQSGNVRLVSELRRSCWGPCPLACGDLTLTPGRLLSSLNFISGHSVGIRKLVSEYTTISIPK